VEVSLVNSSGTDAVPVHLEGELRGGFETADLPDGVAAGQNARLVLHFPGVPPGSFPLSLRLSYPYTPRGTSLVEQLLCTSLENGGPATAPVLVRVGDLSLETAGEWPIDLTSADGAPHSVVVRVEVPKGLGVSPQESRVEVGTGPPTRVAPRLFRGSYPRGTRATVWVLVETGDPVPGSALASASVTILKDPALMPRLRPLLFVVAAGLLLAAFWEELRGRLGDGEGSKT
jgi:hypothetical protein